MVYFRTARVFAHGVDQYVILLRSMFLSWEGVQDAGQWLRFWFWFVFIAAERERNQDEECENACQALGECRV